VRKAHGASRLDAKAVYDVGDDSEMKGKGVNTALRGKSVRQISLLSTKS
jgi:hypothetical protein